MNKYIFKLNEKVNIGTTVIGTKWLIIYVSVDNVIISLEQVPYWVICVGVEGER